MTKLKLLILGLCTTTVTILGTPLGALDTTHPDCAATAIDRPLACPPIADILGLSPSVRASHVFFPGGGAKLDAAAKDQLIALSNALLHPDLAQTCLRLVGHTDPVGPEDVNLHLSYLRAQVVAEFLIRQMGVMAPDISVTGRGEAVPLTNIPKESLAHRRVALEARSCPKTG